MYQWNISWPVSLEYIVMMCPWHIVYAREVCQCNFAKLFVTLIYVNWTLYYVVVAHCLPCSFPDPYGTVLAVHGPNKKLSSVAAR